MASPYFSRATLAFLRELKTHNERAWFEQNRARYEDDVKAPALTLIEDVAPGLAAVSPHFHAGPRSLFRIHRDVRFSNDKRPYKTHVGVHFRHDAGRDAHAPGFYLHVEPGASFVGVGIWRPDGPALARIRERIVDEPDAWRAASGDGAFVDAFEMDGDRLKRAPRGFDAAHPMIEDLKWKDFVGTRVVDDAFVLDRELPQRLARLFAASSPFVRFLCEAVDVAF